jgi:RNA polymerase sigma factor (sigma-70 family)
MRPRDESEPRHLSAADEDTFRQQFEQYYPRVVRWLMRYGFAAEEARDLAQDTFLRVLENIRQRRLDESHFASYLYTVTRNVAFNSWRRRSAQKRDGIEVSLEQIPDRPLLIAGGPDPNAGNPLTEFIAEERQRIALSALRKALSALPPRLRQVASLRLDDLEYKEIAVIMQLSVDSVKAMLLEARRRLRERLADDSPEILRKDSS